MSSDREILGANLLDSSRSKRMHHFGAGHQRSAEPAGYTSRSHRTAVSFAMQFFLVIVINQMLGLYAIYKSRE